MRIPCEVFEAAHGTSAEAPHTSTARHATRTTAGQTAGKEERMRGDNTRDKTAVLNHLCVVLGCSQALVVTARVVPKPPPWLGVEQ